MSAFARHALEVWEAVKGKGHFAGRTAALVAARFVEEVVGDVAGLDEVDEGVFGIDAGRDDVGVDLIAVAEHYALRLAVLDEDFRSGGFGANLDACFASCVGDGVGDCARTAAGKAPGAESA